MSTTHMQIIESTVVENEVEMTFFELCHAVNAEEDRVKEWVDEGILTPSGKEREQWKFSGEALSRAKQAMRLSRDLEINTPGVALALDLIEELNKLRKSLNIL